MLKMMFAAPHSGSGKTAITCGMLSLLKSRGMDICALKCGPDYIDPMFHRSVLGIDSYNLDLFFSGEDEGLKHYKKYSAGKDAVICEGVMGYYDGLGGTTTIASPWHVASVCDFPVILVIRPKGASITVAAEIKGLCEMRKPSHIVGVILNDCTAMLYSSLKDALEEETDVPILGYLPHMQEAVIESRHLGLYTAGEITDLSQRMSKVAEQLEKSVDLEKLFELCNVEEVATDEFVEEELCVDKLAAFAANNLSTQDSNTDNLSTQNSNTNANATTGNSNARNPVIAVASDDAFCFTYKETLDAWNKAGAKIIYFSPLKDKTLPKDVDALYLPGGYPELYMDRLSQNTSMKVSIKEAIESGLPSVAECGGFLYLGAQVGDEDGNLYEGVGALEGVATKQQKLVRFGYITLTAKKDSLLFEKGDKVNAHEFHYWDSSDNGDSLSAVKPISGRTWDCAICTDTMYAGFPHLYFAANPKMTKRFIDAARRYHEKKNAEGEGC